MATPPADPANAATKPRRNRKPVAEVAEDGNDRDASDDAGAKALRKKELLERVQALAKAKKKDVKDVTEAVLKVLGDALAAGEELNLPPLGKAKVNRQKDVAGGEMFIIKLRRGTARAKADAQMAALAEAED